MGVRKQQTTLPDVDIRNWKIWLPDINIRSEKNIFLDADIQDQLSSNKNQKRLKIDYLPH